MRYVHTGCLERWRSCATNRQSYYRCDACLCEYQIHRSSIAQLIRSPIFIKVVTCSAALAGLSLVGALRAFLQHRGKCRCKKSHAYRCPVHADSYMICLRLSMLFQLPGKPLEETVRRALRITDSWLPLLLTPVHTIRSGFNTVSPACELLYVMRRFEAMRPAQRPGMVRCLVFVLGTLATSSVKEFRRLAALMGMAFILKDLHSFVSLQCNLVGQQLGEQVLDLQSRRER